MSTSVRPINRRWSRRLAPAAAAAILVGIVATTPVSATPDSAHANTGTQLDRSGVDDLAPDLRVTTVDDGAAMWEIADVVVQASDGDVTGARRLFAALGGTVHADLPIIGGFAGSIGRDRIEELSAAPVIAAVTPDARLESMSDDSSGTRSDRSSDTTNPLGYSSRDTGSMSAITRMTGAQKLWDAGYTGQGIDVAVIDTGVTRVPGLDGAGKVLDGPDLSFDSIEPELVSKDAFGHGTHMAGIIAGSDVTPGTSARRCRTCLGRSAYTDTTKFVGVAPQARIINVKVGAYDGAADVSQVIAAIDWVVQHRSDPGVNIRVLNLSFGTDSTQDPSLDPLVFAAEQAWKAGIVVVASAGNDGSETMSLATPAVSPSIIAVGASDPMGTISTSDDVVPPFAQHGGPGRTVDVVAPGVSVIGLRVPGGFIDANVETGREGTRFQRASGTSQATAVVSGLAALLLSRDPAATPDMVKAYLTTNARPLARSGNSPSGDEPRSGRGDDGRNARDDHDTSDTSGAGSAFVGGTRWMRSTPSVEPAGTGLGTLEGSRGSYHVTNGETELIGETDIFGAPWDASAWTARSAAGTAWDGGVWNGNRWTGDAWSDVGGWTNLAWTANDATASDWSGLRWKGLRWKGAIWDGLRWKVQIWDGLRWKDASWTSGQWTAGEWTADGWEAGGWSGVRWKGVAWSDAGWT
jgi:serine protease AprX